MPDQRILVTGGSGFIAGHCLLQLLEEGYRVRATLRSLEKEARVRSGLEAAGLTRGEELEFAATDLTSDNGWTASTPSSTSPLRSCPAMWRTRRSSWPRPARAPCACCAPPATPGWSAWSSPPPSTP